MIRVRATLPQHCVLTVVSPPSGLALFVASAGIYTSIFTAWNPLWFNLDELNVHCAISVEHDASLSEFFAFTFPAFLPDSSLRRASLFSHSPMLTARDDKSSGDNNTPDPKLISTLLTYASNPEGLSASDFAAYRVLREKGYPPEAAPGTIADGLRTGEIGLIIPAIGRGDFDVLGVRPSPYSVFCLS